MTATATLVAIEVTCELPNSRTRRNEVWAARTKDGKWLMLRTEEPGSPWWIRALPGRRDVKLLGSLKACRQYITDGKAQRDLDLLEAHDRGEHEGQRAARCGQC